MFYRDESQSPAGVGGKAPVCCTGLGWAVFSPALNGLPGFSSTGLYVLVGAGALMMAVGFFGCCGAMRESQCVLGSVSGVYGVGTGWISRLPWKESGDLAPLGHKALALDPLSGVCFLHLLHENNIIFVPASYGKCENSEVIRGKTLAEECFRIDCSLRNNISLWMRQLKDPHSQERTVIYKESISG